jgi:SAM-dependent methyltransferase
MDAQFEQRTLEAEDGHWWYQGRRAIVLDAVARLTRGHSGDVRTLDAGCGGGRLLVELSRIGPVVGIEPSPASRSRSLERRAGDVLDASIEALPFEDGHFDVVLSLDVLEHLDDDRAALRELRRVTAPGGAAVITVPAHPRLWSRHDELNHHRRRYRRRDLQAAASASGWTVERTTHFTTLLMPVAIAARAIDRGDGLQIPPAPVNAALRGTLGLERALIRAGASLPAGMSLLTELRRGSG